MTMGKKMYKRIAVYIGMSLLFTILGFVVLYIAGTPVITMVESYGSMIITKGAPSYPNEYDPKLSELVMPKQSAFDKSEIQVPALETHYGIISGDKIGLAAPIYYGDSDEILRKGVGQYTASGLPGEGKPILIGGHDGTYFAPLEQAIPGDIITIETNYGLFEYKVTGIKITDVTDTTAYNITQEKEQLILYTCYPFGQVVGDRSERYFVYCDKVEEESVNR
ncbi:MAG: hypothetical protein K0S61_1423 [Anaerocolumna sp.]|nr:hypothetical protein [Anaerocolumna sp.]